MRRIALAVALGLLLCLTLSIPIRGRVAIKTVYRIYLPLTTKYDSMLQGVADTGGDCTLLAQFSEWLYVYGENPPICPVLESVPMIYSRVIPSELGGNSNWVLGFNEPELLGITAEEAVPLWHQIEELYPDRLLVSPAPVGQLLDDREPPPLVGIAWLRTFWDTYQATYGQPPRLDAIAMHVYFANAEQAIGTLRIYETDWRWNRTPIWITEFGTPYQCPDDCFTEARRFIEYIQNDTRVARYAWFASCIQLPTSWYPAHWNNLSLLDTDTCNNLSAYGEMYTRR